MSWIFLGSFVLSYRDVAQEYGVDELQVQTMTISIRGEMKILIRQWKVTSINGLSGSMVAVFSLAVLYEFLSSYHRYLGLPGSKRYMDQDPSNSKRVQDHISRTLSYLLSAIGGYLLMLVVGTCDLWLFVSVVSGAAFGYFLSNPLYTWYSSIEVRNSENESKRSSSCSNNSPERPRRKISN